MVKREIGSTRKAAIMNDNELDKLFREQLKDRPSKPSAGLWDTIEAELDRQDKKVKVHHLSWLKYAAVALAVVGTSTWWYTQQTSENNLAQHSATTQHHVEETATPKPIEKISAAPTTSTAGQKEEPILASTAKKTTLKEAVKQKLVQDVPIQGKEKPTETEHLTLASMPLSKPNLTLSEDLNDDQSVKRRVVEIAPIRPLVDLSEEDTESMLAFAPAPTESVVTGILNKISDVIVSDDQKKPRFSRDEEGSFRIDFNNNFAKNKFKRRK